MAEHQNDGDPPFRREDRIVDPGFTPEQKMMLSNLAEKLAEKVGFEALTAEFDARISMTNQPMHFQQSPQEPQVQQVAPGDLIAQRCNRFLKKYEGIMFYPVEVPIITCKELFYLRNVEIQDLLDYDYVGQKLYNIRQRVAMRQPRH